jgi:hypothetical protein
MNNVNFERVTVYGYTQAGSYAWNWNGVNGGEQYVDMVDCRAILCRNCIRVNEYNGLTVRGGFYQNYDSGPLTIQAGSWFLNTITSGTDTVLVDGAKIQYFEKGIVLSGESGKVINTRFEGCTTTAIEVLGNFCQVGNNCSFSNYITGGVGLAIDIKAGASYTKVGNYSHQSMTAVPVLNAGTNTLRGDAVTIRVRLAGIAATTTVPVFIADRAVLPSKTKIYVGGAALTNSYSNRWNLAMTGRTGYVESYTDFPNASAIYSLFGEATSGSGSVINPGVMASVTLTKNAEGVTIENTYLEVEYVPY